MNPDYSRKIEPNLTLEIQNLKKGEYDFFIGVDEVGRGSWAGPIVACSCWIKPESFDKLPLNINDSKKLTEKQRDEIYKKIKECILFGVSVATNKEIELYGLAISNYLAIKRSLYCLLKYISVNFKEKYDYKFFVLIDGNIVPDFDLVNNINKSNILPLPKHSIKSLTKGDQKVLSISLASIIAKVTRDSLMKNYDKLFPEYKFSDNKGYGTKFHQYKIEENGICEIHRKNFKPMSTIFSKN